MMNEENKMYFQPSKARLVFSIETGDGIEETYVDVEMGYQLDEKLKLYYTGNYKELFGVGVFYAELLRIEYIHESEDIDFKMVIGNDDAPNVELSFKTDKLQGENAKKISLIREIIDYDRESENSLLHKLLK